MGTQTFVVRADDVMPFAPEGREHIFRSQVIIGPTGGAESEHLYMTRFTLLAGQALGGHAHPKGSDETYYILRGTVRLELAPEVGSTERAIYEVGPDTAIFIPGGTFHRLDNTDGHEDIVLLTIWHTPPPPGANGIHDGRIKTWGTTFRKITDA